MTHETTQIILRLYGPSSTSEETLADDTQRLRRELVELSLHSVEFGRDSTAMPSGARAADLVSVGELVVTIATSTVAVKGLVDIVHSWVDRQKSRVVRLSIDDDVLEITGMSSRQAIELAHRWADRHVGND